MSTVRKTISMPAKVHEAAQHKMEQYGYAEFSDYIQALIRADTGVQPGTHHVLSEQPAVQKTAAEPEISLARKAELAAEFQEILSYSKKPKSKKKSKTASDAPPK